MYIVIRSVIGQCTNSLYGNFGDSGVEPQEPKYTATWVALSITLDTHSSHGGNVCPGSDSSPVCCFPQRSARPVSPGQGIFMTVAALSGNATCSSHYGRKNEGFSRCDLTSRLRQLSINGYAEPLLVTPPCVD